MKPKVMVIGSGSSTSVVTKILLDLHNKGVIEVVYNVKPVVNIDCMWVDEEFETSCSLKALPQHNPQKAFLAAMKDKQNKLDSKKSRR